MNAFADTVTVSGFSAGCYMSHKLSIIYSETIKGAGLFSCWPYAGVYDGQDERSEKQMARQSWMEIENAWMKHAIYGNQQMIDNPVNIADQAIYIWSGVEDDVVNSKG